MNYYYERNSGRMPVMPDEWTKFKGNLETKTKNEANIIEAVDVLQEEWKNTVNKLVTDYTKKYDYQPFAKALVERGVAFSTIPLYLQAWSRFVDGYSQNRACSDIDPAGAELLVKAQ